MSYACPYCRDTGRVTEPGRFYGDRSVTRQCPDCAPPRMSLAEWERQIAAAKRAEDAERYGWPVDEVRA